MINVCVAGITGWMGRAIAVALTGADDTALSSGVSRGAAGQTLAAAVGVTAPGVVHATVAEAVHASHVDVLVDYTSATAVRDNVARGRGRCARRDRL